FFFSSRRRHTRWPRDWSSDVCSSDLYEIMRAEDVGWSTNKIVLGKLSGRNAFKQRLEQLGIDLESEAEINAAFTRFKELADRKRSEERRGGKECRCGWGRHD